VQHHQGAGGDARGAGVPSVRNEPNMRNLFPHALSLVSPHKCSLLLAVVDWALTLAARISGAVDSYKITLHVIFPCPNAGAMLHTHVPPCSDFGPLTARGDRYHQRGGDQLWKIPAERMMTQVGSVFLSQVTECCLHTCTHACRRISADAFLGNSDCRTLLPASEGYNAP